MTTASPGFFDDFAGTALDTAVWVPHYLPMWSSRAASAASYRVAGSELRLAIPPEQEPWCAADHEEPLRVSGIQSGVFSGPVGSTIGQQPFREGLLVQEFQPTQWGWTTKFGRLDVRARMVLDPRSMASVWMVGLEDAPERSGEICVFEIFGDALGTDDRGLPTAAVGEGIHPFRDPTLVEDFATTRLAIDVAQFHTYGAQWQPGRVTFSVDGALIRTVNQAPDYPMQLMVAVFDFPAKPVATDAPAVVPELVVDWVRGT
jgi:hypothetical protein